VDLLTVASPEAIDETEALELRRIAEQVGKRARVLDTERTASGILRQADAKIMSFSNGKPNFERKKN